MNCLNFITTFRAASLIFAIVALQPWGVSIAGGSGPAQKVTQPLQEQPAAVEHITHPEDQEIPKASKVAQNSIAESTQPELAPYPTVTPYNLGYKTQINGLNLKSHRVLTLEPDGIYKLYGKASVLFISIEEYSVFAQNPDGKIQPLSYFYDRKGLGGKKDYHIRFDWQKQRAINQLKKDPWELAISDDAQDMLSHQEQFRLDLIHAKPHKPFKTYHYTIVKKGKIKHYQYTPIDEEVIETGAGKLRTLKVEKLESDNDRQTTIWLASDWGYVIARLEYIKGDDVHRMDLTGGQIGALTIHGL